MAKHHSWHFNESIIQLPFYKMHPPLLVCQMSKRLQLWLHTEIWVHISQNCFVVTWYHHHQRQNASLTLVLLAMMGKANFITWNNPFVGTTIRQGTGSQKPFSTLSLFKSKNEFLIKFHRNCMASMVVGLFPRVLTGSSIIVAINAACSSREWNEKCEKIANWEGSCALVHRLSTMVPADNNAGTKVN